MFGFVIRAKSESAARTLAAEQAGDEGPEAWLSPRSATCAELHADGNPEVIMADYNPAGVGSAGPCQTRGQRIDQPHELPARQAR
jgi:hypothetical protein